MPVTTDEKLRALIGERLKSSPVGPSVFPEWYGGNYKQADIVVLGKDPQQLNTDPLVRNRLYELYTLFLKESQSTVESYLAAVNHFFDVERVTALISATGHRQTDLLEYYTRSGTEGSSWHSVIRWARLFSQGDPGAIEGTTERLKALKTHILQIDFSPLHAGKGQEPEFQERLDAIVLSGIWRGIVVRYIKARRVFSRWCERRNLKLTAEGEIALDVMMDYPLESYGDIFVDLPRSGRVPCAFLGTGHDYPKRRLSKKSIEAIKKMRGKAPPP